MIRAGRRTKQAALRLPRLLLLLVLLLPLPVSLAQAGTDPVISASGGTYSNHALSALDTADRVTLDSLRSLTANHLSVTNFETVIRQHFLEHDIRRVLLDVGWQNFTAGSVPFEGWVDNWLYACDALGVQNVLFNGPLTEAGVSSRWAISVIRTDPSARTAFPNGTLANYVSPDNPDVAKFIEIDLEAMYNYYGNHPSWIGLGTGYPQASPYFSTNSTFPRMGYSNASFGQFANSTYFNDTSGTGPFNSDGTPNVIWSSIRETVPSVPIASGIWMTSSGRGVYGNSSAAHGVRMRFFVTGNESALSIQWYGSKTGNPSELLGTIFGEKNGTISLTNVVAHSSWKSGEVSSDAGWQPAAAFIGNFNRSYYWLSLSSPASGSSDYYSVYIRDYDVGKASAVYLLPVGQGTIAGSSILLVKNGSGSELSAYPYQEATIPGSTQSFMAPSAFSFNTIFLFLSDRHYDPTNATITVTDLSNSSEVVATGLLSQQLIHGVQNWTPIVLDRNVRTIKGHTYTMTLSEPNGGYSWSVVLRGLTVDPKEAGFQNQTDYWLFKLGYARWSATSTNYGVITSNGIDAVGPHRLDALRFVPSSDERVNSIQVLMKNLADRAPMYTNGNFTAGIWSSEKGGAQPLSLLNSITVSANLVPTNGWLNVSGFDQTVSGGDYYWLVLSTDSNNSSFPLARLTSPYSALVSVSPDGGRTWQEPAEGPTDLGYGISLTGETLGNFVQDITPIALNPTTEFAQPISSAKNIQVTGLYLGVLSEQQVFGSKSGLRVSINPDNGTGGPSGLAIVSGIIDAKNITFYSNDYVAFSSVARLNAGERYWIVVQPENGLYYVSPVTYQRPVHGITRNDSALISTTAGFSWQRVSNFTTALSYMIASPVTPLPSYSTAQLSAELQEYYNFPIAGSPLRGWNAYVQSSEASTLSSIGAWFDGYTGRHWEIYASTNPIVLQQLGTQRIDRLPLIDDITNCAQLERHLLTTVPLSGTQYSEAGDLSVLAGCAPGVQRTVQELGRMHYLPPASNLTAGLIGVSAESKELVYSIHGEIGGPLLIWLSNPTTAAIKATVSVNTSAASGNASTLSPIGSWDVIDVSSFQTQQVTGPAIVIDVSIPSGEWLPIYIEPVRGELTTVYSTAPVQREFTYPKQGLYDVLGITNQSVITAVASSIPPQAVLLNDIHNLTQLSSSGALLNATEGYYFDNAHALLLIRYTSHGPDSVRVLQTIPVQPRPAPVPLSTVVYATLGLVGVEVSLWFYFYARRTRGTGGSNGQ